MSSSCHEASEIFTPQDLAGILSNEWEEVEKAYIDHSKDVFHKVRDERENIIRYFYQIRRDYQDYLRRPDHKQEFVESWQKVIHTWTPGY